MPAETLVGNNSPATRTNRETPIHRTTTRRSCTIKLPSAFNHRTGPLHVWCRPRYPEIASQSIVGSGHRRRILPPPAPEPLPPHLIQQVRLDRPNPVITMVTKRVRGRLNW